MSLREEADFSYNILDKRAGRTGGKARAYPVLEAPRPTGRPVRGVQFATPTYPNGVDGTDLDEANGE